jgi:hypothetical protein
MAITASNQTIPIRFEKDESAPNPDSRFQKVKVWIAHTGENLNGSAFSRKSLEGFAETLTGIPILGKIRTNEDGDSDFGSHEEVVTIKDGNVSIEMQTVAFGFVGEDNEWSIQTASDGKEWLVAYGNLWTRFTKAIDIFDESGGSKSQSMEIADIGGNVDNRGVFHIETGRFEGLTILGDDVLPGMAGSTISTQFEASELKQQLREMYSEYAKEKGSENVAEKEPKSKALKPEDEKEKDDFAKKPEDDKSKKTDASEEDKAKKSDDASGDKKVEEPKTEDPKSTDSEDKDKDPKTDDPKDDPKKVDDKSKSDDKENPKPAEDGKFKKKCKKFALINGELSYNEIRQKIEESIEDSTDGYAFVADLYQDRVIYRSYQKDGESKFFEAPYSVDSGNVKLGEPTEVFAQFITAEQRDQLQTLQASVQSLTAENTELREFQATTQEAEKNQLIESYEARLSEDKLAEIKTDLATKTFAAVKQDIALALMDEDTPQVSGVQAFNFKQTEKSGGQFGSLSRLFH